ncbi:MAG: cytochrome c oxidase cbb3-type subunit 3 [Alphaproteobacteria bacterium]|jgi:cytochrome c oxidase cbb3-type subunit 3
MTGPRKDDVTGQMTTGHEWDGIEELDAPLPRWWLWVFYACIVWSIGYWIVMPAWPLASDYTKGLIGYSQRAVVAKKIEAARALQAPFARRLEALSYDQISADAELLDFAFRGGASAFAVNCSQCHGAGAAGAKGYPNLNDDDWLWGGRHADIEKTLRVGIRSTHPETHINMMPAFGRDGLLKEDQISDVVEFVLSLSGRAGDRAAAARGAKVFKETCASCHGADGKGKIDLGTPSLVDGIWLFGGTREEIRANIQSGRGGVMPAWQGRLDDATIKALTIYVHALGGGK